MNFAEELEAWLEQNKTKLKIKGKLYDAVIIRERGDCCSAVGCREVGVKQHKANPYIFLCPMHYARYLRTKKEYDRDEYEEAGQEIEAAKKEVSAKALAKPLEVEKKEEVKDEDKS